MSIHINDNAHFAKTVLMPGDPLRAKYIAENFLVDAKLVNDRRGMLAYTGKTKNGLELSVMGSGMGCPSIGIYSYELFKFYGVENIIRIGTCGSLQENIHVNDIIVGVSTSTHSNYACMYEANGEKLIPNCSLKLLKASVKSAKKLNLSYFEGPIFTSDNFYGEDEGMIDRLHKIGMLGIEMESYALYVNAALLNKNALTICTVSDAYKNSDAQLSGAEREKGLNNMIELAITTSERIEEEE